MDRLQLAIRRPKRWLTSTSTSAWTEKEPRSESHVKVNKESRGPRKNQTSSAALLLLFVNDYDDHVAHVGPVIASPRVESLGASVPQSSFSSCATPLSLFSSSLPLPLQHSHSYPHPLFNTLVRP